MTTLQFLNILGVATFAATGALVAGRKNLDMFGTLVVAFVTALGGGTLRDLLLGLTPVFWINDTVSVSVALLTGTATFFIMRRALFPSKLLLILDASGLGLFAVLGAQRALDADASILIATIMGMLTGSAGGALRDVLCGEIPTIFLRTELYATAAICGSLLFCLMQSLHVPTDLSLFCGATLTFIIRIAALKWKMALPLATIREPG